MICKESTHLHTFYAISSAVFKPLRTIFTSGERGIFLFAETNATAALYIFPVAFLINVLFAWLYANAHIIWDRVGQCQVLQD